MSRFCTIYSQNKPVRLLQSECLRGYFFSAHPRQPMWRPKPPELTTHHIFSRTTLKERLQRWRKRSNAARSRNEVIAFGMRHLYGIAQCLVHAVKLSACHGRCAGKSIGCIGQRRSRQASAAKKDREPLLVPRPPSRH